MFPDLWSISKDSSSGCKLCMMDSSLLPYWPSNQCNKNKCFLQQGCRRDSAFVIDEWLSRWLMSGKAGDEVSFILYLLSSFQMWKRFCFLRQRSTTHTTTADVYSKQWPQLSFKKWCFKQRSKNREHRVQHRIIFNHLFGQIPFSC